MNGWIDRQIDKEIDRKKDIQTHMNGWIDRQMDKLTKKTARNKFQS